MKAPPAEIIFQQLTQAFAASQNFPRGEIQRRQAALLERLVRHAHEHTPFYRDSKRLKSLFRPDGAFDLAGWSDVPILTRNDAREHQDALQARNIPEDMGALETNSTSGSTGTPLKFKQTFVQGLASEVLINRALRWHRLWPIQRIAMVAAGSVPVSPGPGMLKLPSAASFAEQVGLLRSNRITHVSAAPSVASAWADAAEPNGLPDLTTMIVSGEVLRPEIRAKIEQKLKVKVVDLYSASELGPIACEGPDGRLLLSEETVLLEGPRGAIDPKALTRVVVTPFYAFGTPLIRYAPGDYVRFSNARVRDAPGLRRLDSVVGRQRNLFRRPDGSLFLPGRLTARSLEAILEFRQWQLVQTSLTDIMLKMVVPRPPNAEQWQALQSFVRTALPDHNTRVDLVDAIENNVRSGKAYEMFLSLIDEGR